MVPTEQQIAEWLDATFKPSADHQCLHCGGTTGVLLPFGGRESRHVWLHGACWPAHMAARRRAAVAALSAAAAKQPADQPALF